MEISDPPKEQLHQAVETFWDTIPPYWHSIRAHIRQVAVEQFDLSVEQFHILRHIRQGRCSVSELADAKNISRPAISQAVNMLVDKGLIVRTPQTRDRRHIQLSLTEDGNVLLDAVFEDTRQWMMAMLSPLSDQELQVLTSAMNSLKKIQTA